MDKGAEYYALYLQGDDEGIVSIIREYKDGLILFLNRYVDNLHTAEDLAEDTFFKLITKKPRFSPRSAFKTWLYTIGRNLALNYLKKSVRISHAPKEDLEAICDERHDLERSYFQTEEKIRLQDMLSHLPQNYSSVLYLKYIEELENTQIAAVLGKSNRQIENLLYQAKQKLKAQLEKEGFVYEGLS